ncbi:MAG: hypothetical protein HYV77_02070 [Candidatus Wildermuthbacteria bacterium]|nr:hypothetical protein [Candidatus Wildermuthbacteria bacterium]
MVLFLLAVGLFLSVATGFFSRETVALAPTDNNAAVAAPGDIVVQEQKVPASDSAVVLQEQVLPSTSVKGKATVYTGPYADTVAREKWGITPGVYQLPGDPVDSMEDGGQIVASFVLLANWGYVDQAMMLVGGPSIGGNPEELLIVARWLSQQPRFSGVEIPEEQVYHGVKGCYGCVVMKGDVHALGVPDLAHRELFGKFRPVLVPSGAGGLKFASLK